MNGQQGYDYNTGLYPLGSGGETMKKKKKKMSPSGIDWPGLTHTWSPIVGCKHRCPYCIAEKWNNHYRWIPKWDDPQIFPERMEAPLNHRKPCSIFVVFLGDLFGDWVDSDFIRSVIYVTERARQHTYWFLTKNPRRYQLFDFGANCKLGVTITGEESEGMQLYKLNCLIEGGKSSPLAKTFVSIEPLQGTVCFAGDYIDQFIVGAQTNPDIAPGPEWIRSVQYNVPAEKIHWKNNIKRYL
jgi:protein gp37